MHESNRPEGWLTGAFEMPHESFQFDIGRERLGCVAPPQGRIEGCRCGSLTGWGEAARSYRNVALPAHWGRRAVLRRVGPTKISDRRCGTVDLLVEHAVESQRRVKTDGGHRAMALRIRAGRFAVATGLACEPLP